MYFEMKIDDNQISEKGCKYISKAEWKKLKLIGLGYFDFTKVEIKSETRAVSIFAKEICHKLQKSR